MRVYDEITSGTPQAGSYTSTTTMSSSRSSLDSHCTLPTPAERAAARLNGVDLESQAYGGTDLREPPPPPPGEKGSKIEADLASQLGLPQGLVLTRAVQDKEYMLLSFDPRHTHPRDPMVRSVTSKYALTLFAVRTILSSLRLMIQCY